MSESPQKSLHVIGSKFVKHNLSCLPIDVRRGLNQTFWAMRPAVTRLGCPLGEQREVSYHQTSWVCTTAMGPEADKGLGHVTWATASERNCSRTECTGHSVQGANPEPQAFRDSRVAFPIESPA